MIMQHVGSSLVTLVSSGELLRANRKVNNDTLTGSLYPYKCSGFHFQYSIQLIA